MVTYKFNFSSDQIATICGALLRASEQATKMEEFERASRYRKMRVTILNEALEQGYLGFLK